MIQGLKPLYDLSTSFHSLAIVLDNGERYTVCNDWRRSILLKFHTILWKKSCSIGALKRGAPDALTISIGFFFSGLELTKEIWWGLNVFQGWGKWMWWTFPVLGSTCFKTSAVDLTSVEKEFLVAKGLSFLSVGIGGKCIGGAPALPVKEDGKWENVFHECWYDLKQENEGRFSCLILR